MHMAQFQGMERLGRKIILPPFNDKTGLRQPPGPYFRAIGVFMAGDFVEKKWR
ncbi:MAG: hypothetical protein M5U34_11225 [Chloroflexi bacterium]|nr:hypothetical protein [Chloroflexota bacterium]